LLMRANILEDSLIPNYWIKHMWTPIFIYKYIVCKPILFAKWSNKQKTKVLCIKTHQLILKIKCAPTLNKWGVRISCTLPPLRYALTKKPVRSGTTM
jgi:hypothetical protein